MQRVDIGTEVTDEELRDLYAYPAELSETWVRVNFVSSIDGGVDVDGVSGGLGTPADRRVFTALRELADVVLVGAGTVRAEDYGGVHTDEAGRERRLQLGLAALPPVAVVSARCSVDPDTRLLTDTTVAPIVLTTAAADRQRKQRLRDAGAQVVEVGDEQIATAALLATLDELGLRRVLCEGGPGLFGQLSTDDAVDELCLTVAPYLVAGQSGRISNSHSGIRHEMACRHVLVDDDGTLLTRWVRSRPPR